VPTFAFKDTIDPIALQQNLAQLSQYFQNGGTPQNGQLLAYNFGNAIMSQQAARPGDYRGAAEPEPSANSARKSARQARARIYLCSPCNT